MRKIIKILLLLSLLIAVLLGGLSLYSMQLYHAPQTIAVPQHVVIARGTPVMQIARKLEEARVIPPLYQIALPMYLAGDYEGLKAGEYRFEGSVSPKEVLSRLRKGEVVQHTITIPEGWTARQVRAALMDDDRLAGELPETIAEGSVLPETYQFLRGDTRSEVLAQMQRAMRTALHDAWQNRAPNLPLNSPEEALVLASIVERETGVKQERARVAAVFINRLHANMRLQSDPTAVYGIEQQTGEPLGRLPRAKDMDVDTPWNTYTRDGLPPTPIANPGRKAIEATLNPLETNEFYFVATGDGGHFFARSLAEHNRNVAKYRRAQRAQKK